MKESMAGTVIPRVTRIVDSVCNHKCDLTESQQTYTSQSKDGLRMKTTFTIGLTMLFSTASLGSSADLSGPGKNLVNEFDFSAIHDVARDRKIPMRLHLPDGDGPFPIVVLSHGAGGNRDANFAQAQHLASHGYATLCIEHVGSNTKRMLMGGPRIGKTVAAMTRDADEVLNRPRDVSFAIDQILRWNRDHQSLSGKFDVDRIGAMGHSFGAFTTLVVCGARPALDWIQPKVSPGSGLGPDLFDKRVRCGIALSPQGPGDPFFLSQSYQSIRVPLIGISGSRDKQQNFEPMHRKRSFEFWPPGDKYLLWIDKANHLSFSDSSGSRPRRKRNETLSDRREDVQQISRAATVLFLNKYLKQSRTAKLREEALRPYVGGIVEDIELLAK